MAQAMTPPQGAGDSRARLLDIIRTRSLLTGSEFRLASGRSSAFFFDMKRTMFDPEGAALLADVLFGLVRPEGVRVVGGLEVGAIPLVVLVTMRSWPEFPIRGFFVRKETKGHGTDKLIDGYLPEGSDVILFDDVTTTGGSVMQAVRAAQGRGCRIVKVITVVDREEGAAENFDKAGIAFASVFNRRDFA